MRSAVTLYREFVGKKALLTVSDRPDNKTHGTPGSPGLQVPVMIRDARSLFKREDLLVVAVPPGVGSGWVSASRVRVVEEWPNESEIPGSTAPGADDPPVLDPDSVEPSA